MDPTFFICERFFYLDQYSARWAKKERNGATKIWIGYWRNQKCREHQIQSVGLAGETGGIREKWKVKVTAGVSGNAGEGKVICI